MPQGLPQTSADKEAEVRRRDRALWPPVMLGGGALIYLLLTFEPPDWAGWVAAALGICALVAAWQVPRGAALVAAMGLAALGFGLAMLRAELVGTPVLQEATRDVVVTGRTIEIIGHPDGRPRLLMDVASIEGLAPVATPRRIRIALRKTDARLPPGTEIEVRARLSTLPLPVAPGAYNFARAAWFDGIGAYGFATGTPRLVVGEAPGWLTRAGI